MIATLQAKSIPKKKQKKTEREPADNTLNQNSPVQFSGPAWSYVIWNMKYFPGGWDTFTVASKATLGCHNNGK